MTNNYWNQQYNRYSRISIEDAMSIALSQIPGEIKKVELDTENGRLVYEVDVVTRQGIEYEMEIDAQTGRITKLKRD
ncbi:PepSY domain-containing protein [Sporosarcina sp. Marseille-Q4063]|uniref:PepSY domain-containing protein n=1 Tax=Sporosarcina sp. Marseille-Q4063 TaxID=2810514 RepID=UPI001BB05A0B|nr:PepSY domain-containing protein [Sporosarcina sp. Marseille-Q4063]QUW22413.1 PepSY domain-containing protein [Sporosarcina sp. Marseille-Q4063]